MMFTKVKMKNSNVKNTTFVSQKGSSLQTVGSGNVPTVDAQATETVSTVPNVRINLKNKSVLVL